MLKIITDITQEKGKEGDIELLEELAKLTGNVALCGLGKGAPSPFLSKLKHFQMSMRHISRRKGARLFPVKRGGAKKMSEIIVRLTEKKSKPGKE